MAYDKFFVGPLKSGLRDDLTSFLIPEDAFTRLNNAYVFRGRLKKRFGSLLIGATASSDAYQNLNSRLRVALSGGSGVGETDATGTATGTIPGSIFEKGQMFSIGDTLYTVYQDGTPASMLKTDGTTTATYNTTTGAYNFAGAPASKQIYFYPSSPVMGFSNYEKGPVNEHTSFAYDRQFIYKYDGSSWDRDDAGGVVFHGENTNLFWAANWHGVTNDLIDMFVTNFNVTTTGAPAATDDPIYYYNGTTWSNFSTSTVFNSSGHYVANASMIQPFKNRLLLLDVVEYDGSVNKRYPNRVRYCHNGSPFATSAWLEPNQSYSGSDASGGGYIDLPIEEEIVSSAFIKDRLIIYCERSTWELIYTGNSAIPFVFEAINQVLGSEAKFSTIIFDKNILTIGTTGVHSCNGAYVQRIDEEVPDKIFETLKTTEGTKKIHGIRDYFNELVYWSFLKQSHSSENTYNDSVIVYNYRNGTWAFNDDCITSFGYLEQEKSITSANSKQILIGSQQGFVSVIDSDEGSSAESMLITNMTYSAPNTTLKIYNHNLRDNDFIKIKYPQGLTSWTDGIYKVTRVDEDTVTIETSAWTGTYKGGGLVSRVARMEIETKDINPYLENGKNVYIGEIEFNVDKTTSGEVTIDYYASTSSLSMLSEASSSGTILGTGVLETRPYQSGGTYLVPLENYQSKLWHKVFMQGGGEFVKLKISLSDEQMLDEDIAESMFVLNGMILYTQEMGR